MNTTNLRNNSIFSYDDFTHKLAIIQGSIYLPIFCAGIANNFLTVLIILLNRDMRTVTYCYLLNLAISDTIPLIVSLPFEISFLPVEVPWGHLGCKFRALLAETSTNASILTISAFTIERYFAVCRPLHNSALSTTRRAIKIQIFIWFIAIFSSTPYFYITKNIDHQCSFDRNFQFFVTICFHISATFFFVIPVFILCFLYALMAQRLYNIGLLHEVHSSKRQTINSHSFPIDLQHMAVDDHRFEQHIGVDGHRSEQRIGVDGRRSEQYIGSDNHRFKQHARATRHVSTPILMSTPQSIHRNENNASPSLPLHIQSMKKSAFKMLFAVVIAFIICYAPFHVQRLITSRLNVSHLSLIQQRAITLFYFISGIFYYIGSTVNPIFYHLFSRKYRLACNHTMKTIIHCERHRRRHLRRYNQNFQKKDKPPLGPRHPNLARAPKTTETIYRSPNRIRENGDIENNKKPLLRLSLPVYIPERIR